ncbi:MAG: zinc ribbon domain-containing protein [Clostridia bacterium]|nr:zinc ribbon domain-containing protein [Clostridia bacterium]
MYCEWCGELIDDNAKKCPNCGKKNPFYKKPKASRKKRVVTLSIVIPLIVVIVTAILVVGYNVEIQLNDDLSKAMHEYIVDNSKKAPIVTMKCTRYERAVLTEDIYAFDSERQICYRQYITKLSDGSVNSISFYYYDIKYGREYLYSGYSNVYYSQNGNASVGKIELSAQPIKTPTYSWDDIKSRVTGSMSHPGRGCANTCYAVLFKGDCDLRFHFATPTTDRVLAEGYKVKKINFFDEVYEFSYEYIESEYFVLK